MFTQLFINVSLFCSKAAEHPPTPLLFFPINFCQNKNSLHPANVYDYLTLLTIAEHRLIIQQIKIRTPVYLAHKHTNGKNGLWSGWSLTWVVSHQGGLS